jgi:hypothetical protein
MFTRRTLASMVLAGVASFGVVSSASAQEFMKDNPAYKAEGATFDQSVFNDVVKQAVDADGYVDYAALKADSAKLDQYIASLATANLDALGRNERLATLINAYNAFTLRLILDNYPMKSIKDIPEANRWNASRWKLAGQTVSLNDLEHKLIRTNFREPRIHFALVCAAVSCPKLRNEAYVGATLDAQLADQLKYCLTDPATRGRWVQYSGGGEVGLTKLFDWYGKDFLANAPSVPAYVKPLIPGLPDNAKVSFIDYSWALNDKVNKK